MLLQQANGDSKNLSGFLQNKIIEKSVSEKKKQLHNRGFYFRLKYHKNATQHNFIITNKRKASSRCYKNKKVVFNNRNITSFIEQLTLLHWRHIDFNRTANEIYDTFLRPLTDIQDANSPIREYVHKHKVPLDQQRSKEILEEKTKIIHQIS